MCAAMWPRKSMLCCAVRGGVSMRAPRGSWQQSPSRRFSSTTSFLTITALHSVLNPRCVAVAC